MNGFSVEWLALREPHDMRARNPDILEAVVAYLNGQHRIRIVDLACGTGSTMRALSPHLPCRQDWRLADYDSRLLARATASLPRNGITVSAAALDLSWDLEAALGGAVDLVTTSALLDLVSESWLARLAAQLAARARPLYAALTCDGRIELAPPDGWDTAVRTAINAHQRTDKGFGPALGPAATTVALAQFQKLGYRVMHGPSDWVIGPADCDIQAEIFSDWARVALGVLPPADVAGWLGRRQDAIAAGRSSLRIGHVDMFAVPVGTR